MPLGPVFLVPMTVSPVYPLAAVSPALLLILEFYNLPHSDVSLILVSLKIVQG